MDSDHSSPESNRTSEFVASANGGVPNTAQATGQDTPGRLGTLAEEKAARRREAAQTLIGKTIDDYEIEEEIGGGGMGFVYKARQRSLNRTVAIKTLLTYQYQKPGADERFRLEAQAVALLDHPHIVPIFDFGEFAGVPYYAMAFIRGVTLNRHVHTELSLVERLQLLLQVSEAIEHAHEHGIIHRDLKPENILIDEKGRARVTDFGLAKRLQDDPNLTGAGEILGTPSYMAPEQALGYEGKIGPYTDVYALGAILYFLLAGRPPFTGKTYTEILCKVVQEPVASPKQWNVDAPAELIAICMKCLAKDPQDRYASAKQFADALQSAMSQRTVVAPDTPATLELPKASLPPVSRPPQAKGGSRPLVYLGVGILALLVIGAVSGYFWMFQRGPEAPAIPEIPQVEKAQLPKFWLNEPPMTEFSLRVKMLHTQPDKDGIIRIKEGESIHLEVETDQDAYLGIWVIEPSGDITQLFPNRHESSRLAKKGVKRIIPPPGNKDYTFDTTATSPPSGTDYLRIVASTEQWTPVAETAVQRGYSIYSKDSDCRAWTALERGIVLKAKGTLSSAARSLVASQTIPFSVSKGSAGK